MGEEPIVLYQPTQVINPQAGLFTFSFGHSVCIDNEQLLIGSPIIPLYPPYGIAQYHLAEDGSVYWNAGEVLAPNNATIEYLYYGYSSSVLGKHAVVSAPYDIYSPGKVFIFEKDEDDGEWSDGEEKIGSTIENGDEFGASISQVENRIAVGAPFHDVGSAEDAGSVYIFEKNLSNQWYESAIVNADSPIEGELFGTSVELFENLLFVGAPNPLGEGQVYVYERVSANTWNQIAMLQQNLAQINSEFGHSISVTRTGDGVLWLFVGVPKNDNADDCMSPGGIIDLDNGIVEVYRYMFQWSHHETWLMPDCYVGSEFGYSLDSESSKVIIGAPFVPLPSNQNKKRGAGYIASYVDGAWFLCAKLQATSPHSGDEFGWSVSVDNNWVAIGAPRSNTFEQTMMFNMRSFEEDCNQNEIDDFSDICLGTDFDCNGNQILDSCEIANGTSEDCNENGIPDSCDLFFGNYPDCDNNGVLDGCEIALDSLLDCNQNSILDSCELNVGLFVIFIIDGSESIVPDVFNRQLNAIKNVLCETSVYDGIEPLLISVIQFSSDKRVEIEPVFFNSNPEQICTDILSIEQLTGSTNLLPALQKVNSLFQSIGSSFNKKVVVMTDGGMADDEWEECIEEADEIRLLNPPTRICSVLVAGIDTCEEAYLLDLANAGLSPNDTNQPVGYFTCLTDAEDLEPLCKDCMAIDSNTGWTFIPPLDCNSNGILNTCDTCPADISNGNGSGADGTIDVSDLLEVVSHWGTCPTSSPCYGDITCDGEVDVADLLEVIGNWGFDCGEDGLGIPRTVGECLNRYPLGSLQLEKCLEVVEYLGSQSNE